MTRFLRTKYENVEIVFIAHHTEAKEVTEEEFFTKEKVAVRSAPPRTKPPSILLIKGTRLLNLIFIRSISPMEIT